MYLWILLGVVLVACLAYACVRATRCECGSWRRWLTDYKANGVRLTCPGCRKTRFVEYAQKPC